MQLQSVTWHHIVILAIEKGVLRSLISQASWHPDTLCFSRETPSICFPWKSDLPWKEGPFEQEMVSVIDLSTNFCSGSCIEEPPLEMFCFSVPVLVLPALVGVHRMSGVTSPARGDPLADGPLCFVREAQGNLSFGDHGEMLNSCERTIFNQRGLECLSANHKDYSFTVNSSGVLDCP